MKIVLHGKLKAAFGDSLQIHADSVEDAIRGLTTQIPEWPGDMLIDVPGFDTIDKLSAKTDAGEIHLIPAMMGGGGKFGSILLGAALIGLSFIPGAQAGTLLLGKFASGVLASGIGMVISGAIGLFMKAPSISRSNDPPASKYLGVNKNTTEIGTPVKLAWGRIPPYGHYLSIQSNSDNMVHAVWPTNPT